MDHRTALKPKTLLCLRGERGESIHCVIERELGRGGSCIVYEASRETETGDNTFYRIKEFFPYKLHITRDTGGTLVPTQLDAEKFEKWRERFRRDFSRANRLFYSGSNYSSMTNQLDIFDLNGTSYILSAYSSKDTLSSYKPKTIKECVSIALQVACVIGNIHKSGYLYLDIKPDNLLIVDGPQKQIQLFDFDSPVSAADLSGEVPCGGIRLSYTKGFSPIELQTANLRRIGAHTDVYGVGALLFYLLFGAVPKAADCEADAVYDFSFIGYDCDKCDGRLFKALTEFFRGAIAVYYADRYQSMDIVCGKLREIERLADPAVPRIIPSYISRPKCLRGREKELEELARLLSSTNQNCLFVTGMGGIGKSTLVKEYLCRNADKFDPILYMRYKDSIENTVSDDRNIGISTLRQEDEINSAGRYFDKKLGKIRELTQDALTVIAIDNFTGEADRDLAELLSTGCKVILITRKAPTRQSCGKLELHAITDKSALRGIFEAGLGRRLKEHEYKSFEDILRQIDSHTLTLELIAKQIASSHITVESAAELTREYGFSNIAPEKVDCEKDNATYNGTIGKIIDALFGAGALSENKKKLLKVMSLIGDAGIGINQFQRIMRLSSKDDINELIKDGWLTIFGDTLSMHRVIKEAVRGWTWTQPFEKAAELFLSWFYIELRIESTKNSFPKKLHDLWKYKNNSAAHETETRGIYRKLTAWRDRIIDKQCQTHGLGGLVTKERWLRAGDDSPADIRKLSSLLLQSEDILSQCKREPVIKNSDIYVNLLYITLLCMPQYKKDCILSETSQIFTDSEINFVIGGTAEPNSETSRNPITIMRLYERVVLIYAESKRYAEAEEMLKRAKKTAETARHRMVYAHYYDMLSEYYDILLNGAYDSRDSNEEALLCGMLDAIDRTLKYSKKYISRDGCHLYIKNILAKATVLLRSEHGTDKEIADLIVTAGNLIEKNTSEYADVRLQYYLVCAWYYALQCCDAEAAEVYIEEAWELSEKITPNALRKIEDLIVPCANIYFELACREKAIALLCKGTRLCAEHANTDAYDKIKQELCDHIWQVGIEGQLYDLCGKIIRLIDRENEEIFDEKNKVFISEEIRNAVSEETN